MSTPGNQDLLLAPLPDVSTRAWRTLLVATDGSPECDGAFELARALVSRTGATVRAIAVTGLPPLPGSRTNADSALIEDSETAAMVAATVQEQLERLQSDCPFVVRTGPVVDEVPRYARESHADLLITGRGRHGTVERLLGEVHLLRLLRSAPCPVLAVQDGGALPRRVVIAVDFSAPGHDAARVAVDLAAPDAALYLVHVKPDPPFGIPHPGRWLRSYDAGVREGLERLREALALPRARVVETIVVHGHPGVALVAFARTARADLIAAGLQGAEFLDRLAIGSVTSHLVRTAPCSLLFSPGPGGEHAGNGR